MQLNDTRPLPPAFTRFKNLHFVFRYEGSDLNDRLPPNVHLFKWIPQADLLRHPKTVAFITHGVSADSHCSMGRSTKECETGSKAWIAVNLRKDDISATTVTEALTKLFTKRETIVVDGEEAACESGSSTGVAWAEFVAEFKTLDNLVPAGTKLNFIQYHSLDVIAFLSTVVLLVIFILWRLLRFLIFKIFILVSKARKLKQT
ncbi:hypothetical protein OSTOST_07206 [Ostertagia ostertagi]